MTEQGYRSSFDHQANVTENAVVPWRFGSYNTGEMVSDGGRIWMCVHPQSVVSIHPPSFKMDNIWSATDDNIWRDTPVPVVRRKGYHKRIIERSLREYEYVKNIELIALQRDKSKSTFINMTADERAKYAAAKDYFEISRDIRFLEIEPRDFFEMVKKRKQRRMRIFSDIVKCAPTRKEPKT